MAIEFRYQYLLRPATTMPKPSPLPLFKPSRSYGAPLVGSVVLHAVILGLLTGAPPGPGPVFASLVPVTVETWLESPEPEPEAEPVEPEPEARPPEAIDWHSRGARQTAGARANAPTTPVEPIPEAASEPTPGSPEERVLLTGNSEAGAGAISPGEGGGAPGAGEAAASSGSGGADHARLGSLARDYAYRIHRLIADSARRDYPRAALRAQMEGRVLLAVTVDRSGRVTAVRVARTSGHQILDQAAVAAVQALRQVPAPPEELPWQQEQTLPPLPVTYQLRI